MVEYFYRQARVLRTFLVLIGAATLLGACATTPPGAAAPGEPVTTPEMRIADLEKQLAERQKQCAEEKRRLEAALRDTQKRLDETQKKLDALLEIERSVRKTKGGR